ncbi:MAG: energy-coupling factor transport system substrate-specific component [Sphingomonadales bacterium]|nr:energy-coupling factor transport system substrate-specific component [Sphingomonadales bacterium]
MHTSSHASAAQTNATLLGVAGLCIALNVGLGAVVYITKLPIYLDAVGTITFAILAGALRWRGFALAALVGAASFVIEGLLINPVIMWFIPTQIAIAAYSMLVARPLLRDTISGGRVGRGGAIRVIALGVGLGVVAGLVSAPIITYVFGGITGAGASVIVAVLLKSGETLYSSVLATGLASEPLDKTIQLAAAVALLMATPHRVRSLFVAR